MERWGKRIIDIDIIVMKDEKGREIKMKEKELEIKNKSMKERELVMVKINDIENQMNVGERNVDEWDED